MRRGDRTRARERTRTVRWTFADRGPKPAACSPHARTADVRQVPRSVNGYSLNFPHG